MRSTVTHRGFDVASKPDPAIARVAPLSLDDELQHALKWLKDHSTKATRDGMARYAIPSDHALGVAMRDIKALGKTLGHTRDFDNWAFCDAMAFNLFDRTPHAWTKVAQWSSRRNEFEKRTAFALLWSLTVHH